MTPKQCILRICCLVGALTLLLGCASKQPAPSRDQMEPPEVSLKSFQVPQYDGYWYYSGKIEPTKGQAGDHGAPLLMSFLFAVHNPNPFPVRLDSMTFTVAVEGFSLMTVNSNDVNWVPAERTDEIRLNTLVTTRSALLNLLVTGGSKLKEKGMSPWQAMERWWTKLPSLEIPVQVKEGSATFRADGISEVIAFREVYPPEDEE